MGDIAKMVTTYVGAAAATVLTQAELPVVAGVAGAGVALIVPVAGYVVYRLAKHATKKPTIPRNLGDLPLAEQSKIIEKANKFLGIDAINEMNIGFCGDVNAGKSRLINVLRGVKEGDNGWAKTDFLECTSKITKYSFPQHSFIMLWDIPGLGTNKVPAGTYFENQYLRVFDELVILVKDVVRKEDVDIALQALKYNVPCAFVCSFCDTKITADGSDFEAAKNDFLKQASAYFCDEMNKYEDLRLPKIPFYCISSKWFEERREDRKLQEEFLIDFIIAETSRARGVPLS